MNRLLLLALTAGLIAPLANRSDLEAQAAGTATSTRLTLPTALAEAFSFHPSLRAVDARRSSAEQRVSEAASTRWPSVALQYSVTRFEEPMVTTPIHAFDPARFPGFDETLAQGSLGLRYTVLDWGTRSSSIGAASAGVEVADAGSRLARMRLIESVTGAYLRLAAARSIDAAASARVDALREEVARAERALEAGTAADVERLRAVTALQDALAQRTTTSAAVVRATRDVARLTGLAPDRVAGADLDDPTAFDLGGQEPERPADGHPLLEQASGRAEAARAAVSAERATRLPRLDLTGAMLDFGTLSDEHVFEWQVGAQLSWTLFSGGRRRSSVRRAAADLSAAEADIEALALDVQAAQDAARTEIESADARSEALDLAVEQWEELLRIETLALEAGAGTQRALLDAQAGLFNARAGRVQAWADAALSRVRLASARGTLTVDLIQTMTRRTP